VHLVFLAFQPAEEPLDTFVPVVVALDNELPLLVGQVPPRRRQPDPAGPSRALQIDQMRPIGRLGERLDGVLLNRLRLVRHRQVQVELDDVAEPVTRRAGAEGAVEREQSRLWHLVRDAAPPALEPFAEPVHDRRGLRRSADLHGKRRPAPFQVGCLDRVGHPPHQVGSHLQAVHHDLETGAIRQHAGIDVIKPDRAPIDDETAEALLPQRPDRGRDRCWPPAFEPGGRGVSRGRRPGICLTRLHLGALSGRHDRKLEPEQQPSSSWQRQ